VSSSGSCSSASDTSGNFYLLNDGTTNGSTPEIVGKSIKSGALSSISGSPWALSSVGTPYSAVVAPNGKFLLVSTSNGVYTYLIKGGTLDDPVLVAQDEAYAIQIDSTDSWLIEELQGTNSVTFNAVPIDPTTGKYTSGTTRTVSIDVTNADVQPNRMVLSPDNTKVFAALGTGGTIVVPFSSGTPFPNGVSATKIPVVNSNYGSALSVAVDPKSRLFYIGETSVITSTSSSGTSTSGGLRAFPYASSTSSSPSNISGSPIASGGGGLAPNFILPEASGNYVYVANGNGQETGNITGFAITGSNSTYTISAGSTVDAAVQPVGLAEDSNDTYILAVSKTQSPYLEAYTFDSTTGELSSQITSSDTSYASIAVVAAP
jgi:hypothetical protein